MKSYALVLLCLSPVLFRCCLSDGLAYKLKFINDFFSNEGEQNILIMKTCWSPERNLKFVRLSNSPIEFASDANTFRSNANHVLSKIWFIINMNCTDSLTYMQQVSMQTTNTT